MNRKMALGFIGCLSLLVNVYGAAPSITLKDTDGAAKNFSELTGGKRKVLFFWASWCHFCRGELEKMPENADFIKKNNIEMIGINIGESATEAKAYKDKSRFTYPVFLDEEQNLAQHFSILGIPTFIYFVDGKEVGRNNYFIPKKVEQIFDIQASTAAPAAPSKKTPKK